MKFFLILILLLLFLGCSNEEVLKEEILEEELILEETIEVEPKTYIIEIKNLNFVPYIIEINKGDTIVFINKEDKDHRIISEGLFDSKDIIKNKVYSYTFSKKGEFKYYCSYYPSMKGTIFVN